MYCHYPWTTLYLSAAGKARVCCNMPIGEDLGDFHAEAGVGAAWNGPQLQSVREHIRDGRVHPACRECVSHRSYEMHTALMNPIRAELGIPEAAPRIPEPPAAIPVARARDGRCAGCSGAGASRLPGATPRAARPRPSDACGRSTVSWCCWSRRGWTSRTSKYRPHSRRMYSWVWNAVW